ncbi:hypothetical protein ACVGWK_01420, partial [Enterobacter sichuanensis]
IFFSVFFVFLVKGGVAFVKRVWAGRFALLGILFLGFPLVESRCNFLFTPYAGTRGGSHTTERSE